MLQGVDDAAKNTKQAVSNVQSSTRNPQATINQQASNVQQGIDQGADRGKDLVEGAPQTRADAKQTVSSQAGSLQSNVDQGADALKDAVGGGTTGRRDTRYACIICAIIKLLKLYLVAQTLHSPKQEGELFCGLQITKGGRNTAQRRAHTTFMKSNT